MPKGEQRYSLIAYQTDDVFQRHASNNCSLPHYVVGVCPVLSSRRRRSKTSISKKEEKLLRQLRQITLLMQEGRLDGASPEMEAEEMAYGADWEGLKLFFQLLFL